VTETSQRHVRLIAAAGVARLLRDHRRAAALDEVEAGLPEWQGETASARLRRIIDLALAHDLGASRRAAAEELALGDPGARLLVDFGRLAGLDDWASPRAREIAGLDPARINLGITATTRIWPWIAYARARTGDLSGAEALIERTPADCYLCVRMRAAIAAVRGDYAGAERWWAEAIRQAPSLPTAWAERGRMRLDRGEIDAALSDFAAARARGPRWPDPVEFEGEALLARRDYEGAARKFEEAARAAPRWGRLHLKWGEALAALGRREAAQAQWRRAATLDLSDADRATLAARRIGAAAPA
jgi:tetratricopeptide (TPR) repeat protein